LSELELLGLFEVCFLTRIDSLILITYGETLVDLRGGLLEPLLLLDMEFLMLLSEPFGLRALTHPGKSLGIHGVLALFLMLTNTGLEGLLLLLLLGTWSK
jgi:hypothetical protein